LHNPNPASSAGSSLLRPYYGSLDGLRALAFFAVFCWHCGREVFSSRVLDWGWAGVDLFFVLSGFLITGILFDSLDSNEYFHNFYTRRSLRIFPLYYFFWFSLLLLTPVLKIAWNRYNLTEAIYLGNFFTPGAILGKHALPGSITWSLPGLSGHRNLLVDHFWSLCVEEQYYLIWPAVIYLVRARTRLLMICVIGIICSPLLRLAILHFYPTQLPAFGLYYPTYVRCDSLLWGSAIALLLRAPKALPIDRVRKAAWLGLVLPLATIFLVVYLRGGVGRVPITDPFICTFGYSLIAIAGSALLFLAIFPGSPFASFLQARPLVAVGRVSYGMYISHEILLTPLDPLRLSLMEHRLGFLFPILIFVFCFCLARFSFRFIESPFLRLKDRFAPRSGASDPPTVPANA
jgi:peptidoglycan/LPS O-acetylase OafA/YrhL